jgi:hypothetical protein
MTDEVFNRQYQAARAKPNGKFDRTFQRLSRAIANSFRVLNRIEYEAPWLPPSKDARCA